MSDTHELRQIAQTIESNGGWHIAAIKVRAAANELEALAAENERLRKRVESMLRVVDCASILSDIRESDGADPMEEHDEMKRLFELLKSYRGALDFALNPLEKLP